ncbi:AbrB/MazE/SpoVT family DNA-binding domain-containing protein [Pilimelia columellifera]|uniref:AbrB/MazE/SpoVT family DNA-binding domain-containing protein n=1 Tax=Pilimelia columellifera TaxID=706574 RepID=UPI0031D86834
MIDALGWPPGTAVAVAEASGLIVVTADPGGATRVTAQRHIRIPAVVRAWCGLVSGSWALLVADPDHGRLVIYPPPALDALINRVAAAAFGGDPS